MAEPTSSATGRWRPKPPRTNVHGVHVDEEFSGTEGYLNYELSWLEFNWRVLREATDPVRNPLLERVRFLAITASNLDEFFQKRVGGLKRQVMAGVTQATVDGRLPDEQLQLVRGSALRMGERMNRLLRDELLPALAGAGIRIKQWNELTRREKAWAIRFFDEQIFPVLTPLAVDPGHPFPFISNLSLSLGVELRDRAGRWHFARVKVPGTHPRLVECPRSRRRGSPRVFVPLEQIIAARVQRLFPGMRVAGTAAFRVTRNADIEYEGETDDLLDLISEELRHRRYAPVVRLQVDRDVSPQLRELLMEELEVTGDDVYVGEGFLGLVDLFALADLDGFDALRTPAWMPRPHPVLRRAARSEEPVDMFALLRTGDLLVHHPYQSFDGSVVALLEQAAHDPQVLAIKQTLYRTSPDGPVIRALLDAAESGKQVAVLVELKARFDEARNIELAQRLEDAGIHVAYGVVGLKTHCKTTLIVRREEGGRIRRYWHIGTGNYNPLTARLYEDIGLMSCDEAIADDLAHLFNDLTGFPSDQDFDHLLVAPRWLRRGILAEIGETIEAARSGQPARIIAKMNNLEDPLIIQRLYQASQAGVEIDLIVRSVCRLVPGRPGMSERIRVRSLVGRFLEHSRLFWFEHGEATRFYLGSADLMRRNLDRRVEVLVPVPQPALQAYIRHYLELQLRDRHQSWQLDARGCWTPLSAGEDPGAPGVHAEMVALAETAGPPVAWQPSTRPEES